MSKKINLRNAGERKIQIGGKDFAPGTTASFPQAEADRLVRLYPNEIAKTDENVVSFDELPSDGVTPNKVEPQQDSTGEVIEDDQTEEATYREEIEAKHVPDLKELAGDEGKDLKKAELVDLLVGKKFPKA